MFFLRGLLYLRVVQMSRLHHCLLLEHVLASAVLTWDVTGSDKPVSLTMFLGSGHLAGRLADVLIGLGEQLLEQ